MVRHEKNIGLLLVAWGYDATLAGYYLSVTDRRLAWREEQSTEVEDIVYKVSSDGTGHFFDLHTYVSGGGGGGGGRFGYKVSDDTIFTFMRRYGIDPAKIFSEDAIGSDDDIKTCANARCSVREILQVQCGSCHSAWYCSKVCQIEDRYLGGHSCVKTWQERMVPH